MAWTTNNFADIRATGTQGVWRTAIFEFCRAINQREAAIGVPKTQFHKKNGDLAVDLLLSDFESMRITGSESFVRENLIKIHDRTLEMIETFTQSAGVSERWSGASIATAIGTSLPSSPTRMTNAAWFQGIKEILDRLRFLYAEQRASASNSNPWLARKSDPTGFKLLAWDNRDENEISGDGLQNPRWELSHSGGLFTALAMYRTVNSFEPDEIRVEVGAGTFVTQVSGSLIAAQAAYEYQSMNIVDIDVPCEIDGEAFTLPGESSGSGIVSIASASIDAPYQVVSEMDDTGSGDPFDPSAPVTFGDIARFSLQGVGFTGTPVQLFVDITSELTDQA